MKKQGKIVIMCNFCGRTYKTIKQCNKCKCPGNVKYQKQNKD